MKPGLSGYVPALNVVELDYPLAECIASMLPVCDEVVVSDGGSHDGTLELVKDICAREPKVRLVLHPIRELPWTEDFYNTWINRIRGELLYTMQFLLDADEILDPGAYLEIRRAVRTGEALVFQYVNFWIDAQHVCPWGDGVKLHLAPTHQFMYSHGEEMTSDVRDLRASARRHPSQVTYHYSALRRRAAFFAKCKAMSGYFGRPYADTFLIEAERGDGDFMAAYPDRVREATPFDGVHPALMRPWLQERGWI